MKWLLLGQKILPRLKVVLEPKHIGAGVSSRTRTDGRLGRKRCSGSFGRKWAEGGRGGGHDRGSCK